MRGSKAITEKEAWEKLQWVGTRNGDFFQDFPPRAISTLVNSSFLGLGITGTIIYIVKILE